ncbi:MAG: ABC transporter ATP-binding protein [Alphaproteobacteria bacterium]
MTSLELENVSHRFGQVLAVDDLTLAVEPGEILLLVGPSGCGKSTLLRLAAGLEDLQTGRILIGGTPCAVPGRSTPPEKRGVGLVFQDYALFPHLTIYDNVAFGLLDSENRRERAMAALASVGMADLATGYPHELSGGQQQRVALARALAPRPRIMLLDEPFSGLDARLRDHVRDETLHILKDSGTTALMVTHDPEEAMFMADRIAVMQQGGLAQIGSPRDIYFAPRNAFVANFFSEVNQVAGQVRSGRIETPLGTFPAGGMAEGTDVEVMIRPEAIILCDIADSTCHATVQAARLLGRTSLIHMAVPASNPVIHVHARVPGCVLPSVHATVGLVLNTELVFVFPAPSVT